MDKRILSDEELLGIIKKNAGGGGGGTGNYNDLSNKPQIGGVTLSGNKSASDLGLVAAVDGKGLSTNDYTDADKAIVGGVTAALADKADKSAVKNEFIGKTAEWNALTTAQKKAYDTYQITDDYTEGSGGLPDYSTTEQKTGQKWIDGKDIYFVTVEVGALPNNTSKLVSSGITTADTVIKFEAIAQSTSGGVLPLPYVDDVLKSADILIQFSKTSGELRFLTGTDYSAYNAVVTLYYTKTT